MGRMRVESSVKPETPQRLRFECLWQDDKVPGLLCQGMNQDMETLFDLDDRSRPHLVSPDR